MDQKSLAETFQMIIDGDDIAAPSKMLKGISQANAAKKLPGFPYSIIENLWHTVFWQEIWLDNILGRKPGTFFEDWQSPDASEWKKLKQSFLDNQAIALKLCQAKPFKHKMKSKDKAMRYLMNIAIHDAYHIGQINLMKRVLRSSK